jgi:bifunctional enzyme CysN/CysC
MVADGRSITVQALNRRRRAAVELRLAGASLRETVRRTELSAPTVIKALEAYRAGGWAAVAVGPRGRGIKKPRAAFEQSAARGEPQFALLMQALAARIGIVDAVGVPLSRLRGANFGLSGPLESWFRGPTLARWLKHLKVDKRRIARLPFRMSVQERDQASKGDGRVGGIVVSGTVKALDPIRMLPAGRESRVARILVGGKELSQAVAGQRVSVVLADDIEVPAQSVLCAAQAPASVADQFEAVVLWIGAQPLLRGRAYLMRIVGQQAAATIAPIKYRIDTGTLEHLAANKLEPGEIGVCDLELDRPLVFDPYAENRATGEFILVDPLTGETVGAGLLKFALRRAHNVHRQHLDIDRGARAALKRQEPCVLWFTGLSGAGKSTIANLVEKKLHAAGYHTYILDGDNVRHGLSKDLGFTDADRVENIRRIAEVAKLMVDAGLIVLTSFISPFRAERRMARELLQGEFLEVFIDAPLALAEQRDPKGLYRKARRGELKNFTGIDSPYEAPETPDLRLDTATLSPEAAAELIIEKLRLNNRLRNGIAA